MTFNLYKLYFYKFELVAIFVNHLVNKIWILLTCKYVGNDEFGNKFYQSRFTNRPFNRKSRHVIYNGITEASKVPSRWANWIHFQVDEPPKSNDLNYKWQELHKPNLTGTRNFYLPDGCTLANANRTKATGDYSKWTG